MMNPQDMSQMMNRMMGGGFLWNLLLLIALVALVVWILRALVPGWQISRHQKEDSPLEIAKRRYAKGEIDKDEFDRLKRELS